MIVKTVVKLIHFIYYYLKINMADLTLNLLTGILVNMSYLQEEWAELSAAVVAGTKTGWVKPKVHKVYTLDEVRWYISFFKFNF